MDWGWTDILERDERKAVRCRVGLRLLVGTISFPREQLRKVGDCLNILDPDEFCGNYDFPCSKFQV